MVKSIIGYELRGDQSLKMKVCRNHFDSINKYVNTLEEAISDLSKSYHKFIELATTIPGITEKFASFIIAQIGVDMAAFQEQYDKNAIKRPEKRSFTIIPPVAMV